MASRNQWECESQARRSGGRWADRMIAEATARRVARLQADFEREQIMVNNR
jgi:hypothetical protein